MVIYLLSLLLLSMANNMHAGNLIKLYNASNVTIEVSSARQIKLAPQQSGELKSAYLYHDPKTKEASFSFGIKPLDRPEYRWKYEKNAFRNIQDPIVVLYDEYALTLTGKEAHAIIEAQKSKAKHPGAPGGPAFPEEEKKRAAADEA